MADPITLSAGAIAMLAFQKFIESGAGELAKKFTETAINTETAIKKMDDLRQKIVARLKGKSETLDAAIVEAEKGDAAAVETIGHYLNVAMLDYPEFADEIRALAHEITIEQKQDNSSMMQTNYGGRNYQMKTGDHNTNFWQRLAIAQLKSSDTMQVKVTEQGLLIPRALLAGIQAVEVRREGDRLILEPVSEQDPILELGSNPVPCGLADASENLDAYLYHPNA